MLRLVLEIEGISTDEIPMEFVEEYVLSSKLVKRDLNPSGLPLVYDYGDMVRVRIVEGEQQ